MAPTLTYRYVAMVTGIAVVDGTAVSGSDFIVSSSSQVQLSPGRLSFIYTFL